MSKLLSMSSQRIVYAIAAGVLVVAVFSFVREGRTIEPKKTTPNENALMPMPAVYAKTSGLSEIHHGNEVIKINFSIKGNATFVAMTQFSYQKLHGQGCGIEFHLFDRKSKKRKAAAKVLETRVPIHQVAPQFPKPPGFNGGGLCKFWIFSVPAGDYSLVLKCVGGSVTRTGERPTMLLMQVNAHESIAALAQRDHYRQKELLTLTTAVNRLLEQLKPSQVVEDVKKQLRSDRGFRREIFKEALTDKEFLAELKKALGLEVSVKTGRRSDSGRD